MLSAHTLHDPSCDCIIAGKLCSQNSGCPGAMAARYPPCNGTAALGAVCAGADARNNMFVSRCTASGTQSGAASILVCAKQQVSDAFATCVTEADAMANDWVNVRCSGGAATAPPPPPPPLTGPAASGNTTGVCCGAGLLASTSGGVSQCCAWEVDTRGQCCAELDACGLCNGGATTRDAAGETVHSLSHLYPIMLLILSKRSSQSEQSLATYYATSACAAVVAECDGIASEPFYLCHLAPESSFPARTIRRARRRAASCAGVCCAGVLSEDQACCETSLDRCGVCDGGDQGCSFSGTLQFAASGPVGLAENYQVRAGGVAGACRVQRASDSLQKDFIRTLAGQYKQASVFDCLQSSCGSLCGQG